MMLVAAGLMTGCGKDSEETPTKPEDPIPPVTTTYEIGDYYENGFVKGIVIYIDSEGKSGTVVSLDETEAIWSYKYVKTQNIHQVVKMADHPVLPC